MGVKPYNDYFPAFLMVNIYEYTLSALWGAIPLFVCLVLPFSLFFIVIILNGLRRNLAGSKEALWENGKMNMPLIASTIRWKDEHPPLIRDINKISPIKLKRYAPVHWALNNINPQLAFYSGHLEYLEGATISVSVSKRSYAEVEQVDVLSSVFDTSLLLSFKNHDLAFVATASEPNIKKAIKFLQKKHCPISKQAKTFMAK